MRALLFKQTRDCWCFIDSDSIVSAAVCIHQRQLTIILQNGLECTTQTLLVHSVHFLLTATVTVCQPIILSSFYMRFSAAFICIYQIASFVEELNKSATRYTQVH